MKIILDAALDSGTYSFIYPSFYEGFGLLQAMRRGIPAIALDTSSLPEEVVASAGIKIGPTDSDAPTNAMLKIYNDDSLRKQVSNKSLFQAKRFSWKDFTAKTLKGYTMALKNC